MSKIANAILARWGRDAFKEYDRVSGGGCTEQATIPMVMASLAHRADQIEPGSGEEALKTALALYTEERKND